jgi:hypothetical protein
MTENSVELNIVAEQYWRSRIANEIKIKLMPLCVCEKCGNQREGRLIEDAIAVAEGKNV